MDSWLDEYIHDLKYLQIYIEEKINNVRMDEAIEEAKKIIDNTE